jgi:hypothetical protein
MKEKKMEYQKTAKRVVTTDTKTETRNIFPKLAAFLILPHLNVTASGLHDRVPLHAASYSVVHSKPSSPLRPMGSYCFRVAIFFDMVDVKNLSVEG